MSSQFAELFNNASRLDWWKNPPVDLEKRVEILHRFEDYVHDDSEHGEALRDLVKSLRAEAKDIADEAKRDNPLAFATLSYEQILKCNSWVWGVTYICDFDANRKGKTAGAILSALLWIFPNDPVHRVHPWKYWDEILVPCPYQIFDFRWKYRDGNSPPWPQAARFHCR